MPKSERKKKKSKKGLSTEDILKIIKKLKPKTQQIVKVNVGDKSDKKKAGNVQSSYNPPFVFPAQGYPAITSLGQPPFQAPLIDQPRQAASWSVQPVKEQRPLLPPPSAPPLRRILSNEPFETPSNPARIISKISDVLGSESEFSDVERTIKLGKGYTTRQPRVTKITRENLPAEEIILPSPVSNIPQPTFYAPKSFHTSTLSSSATAPSFFNLPVQNDRFQADIINTGQAGDQIGTIANSLPSELWTGSPSGDVVITPEEIAVSNEAAAAAIVSPEEVFLTEEEEQQQQQQQQQQPEQPEPVKPKKEKLRAPETLSEIIKVKTPLSETSYTKTVKASFPMIAAVNDAIGRGFKSNNIPSELLYQRGVTKGFIKKDAKQYLLLPIYEEVSLFNKQKN